MNNIILMTDSYKFTHWKQYPPKTTNIYSYFESRTGAKYDETLFFGLQYFLKKYLEGRVVTTDKIDYAEERVNKHFGRKVFNKAAWEHIVFAHDGHLPVEIKAVPEGTLVPTSNVLMTIENTDPQCFWLTNYLETLLVETWYPSTVATQSYWMKQTLRGYLERTGTPESIDFKLHDFGFRGVTCPEQAGLGGAAHLVNFKGTDNFAAVELAHDFYDSDMAGNSIPASEHSTITSWGQAHELDAFRNMLDQYPEGYVACVSDSYNIWDACNRLWGTELRDKILARNGTLVVRPDTGTPYIMVLGVLDILGKRFGYEENNKGFKVLDPHVRVIQGDGINPSTMNDVLFAMEEKGWSADNIAFGSGGGLLQTMNRDTQKFAFKCSSAVVDEEARDVWKDPITDQGKMSKRGRLELNMEDGKFYTNRSLTPSGEDLLKTVFKNGEVTQDYDMETIRNVQERNVYSGV